MSASYGVDGMDIMGGFPSDVRGLFALVGDTPPPADPNIERPRVDEPPRGRSGRAHFSGFIQVDEPNRKWIGVEGLRLADQMWRTDGDIKRATLATWGPIQSASWAWEPFGGEKAGKKDKEAAEIVDWNMNEYMAPNFVEHLAELGPILMRSGYTDFEQIWKSVSQNGKSRVAVKKLDLRLPRTIWKFYQDEDGDLSGVVQLLPNSKNVWIPANDILHYRVQAEGDNWTGTSLYRHAYKHWYYKEKLEAIDAIGQERKAVGVPVVYPPEGAAEQTKEEIEAILANLHTNEAGFIVMPGPKRQATDGPNIGWEIDIITFDSSSSSGIKESIDQQTTKIAGAFMTDFLELGHHQVGARATAEVQEDPFMTAVNALGTLVSNPLQKLGARIASMNLDGLQGFPKLRMVMHDEASLSEISTYVQQLIVAEAITPDPDLEDWLREHGNLPAVNAQFRQEREAEREKVRESQEDERVARKQELLNPTPSQGENERGEGAQGAPEKQPAKPATKEIKSRSPAQKAVGNKANQKKELDAPSKPPAFRKATTTERCRNCKMGYHWDGADGWCSGYDEPDGTPWPIEVDTTCNSWELTEDPQLLEDQPPEIEKGREAFRRGMADKMGGSAMMSAQRFKSESFGDSFGSYAMYMAGYASEIPSGLLLDTPVLSEPTVHEDLLSKETLSEALDNARESMENAAQQHVIKMATVASLRGHSGRKVKMVPPPDLKGSIASEFERLYALGYRTVAEELQQQHHATNTEPVLMLDAADGDPTPVEEASEQEGIAVTPIKRQRRVTRRATIAAEHITNEATREAERQALSNRDSLTQQRAVEAKALAALHKEAMTNASSVINEGRKDAAVAAAAIFAAKRMMYGGSEGESTDSVGGPALQLQGIYTSVLDERTCDSCGIADDGMPREPDDPALEVPNPLCKGSEYCRCMVVWVLSVIPATGT